MAKVATRYLEVDPWAVVERGFHPKRSRVSESIFSLANEHMGVRGYFDEGYGEDTLVGSYLNGVFADREIRHPHAFKGMVTRWHFMVNSVDWLHTRITLGRERLDLARSKVTGFVRRLDLKTGTLTREFVWHAKGGRKLKVSFLRFLSMTEPNVGCSRMTLEALNFSGNAGVRAALDFSVPHEEDGPRNYWTCARKGREGDVLAILGTAERSGQRVFSGMRLRSGSGAPVKGRVVTEEKLAGLEFKLALRKGEAATVDRLVVNRAERRAKVTDAAAWSAGMKLAERLTKTSLDDALARHAEWWRKTWEATDVAVEGDPETQQGVRFCIFQMHQTYHGVDPSLNVGAKGLTGEVYSGHTFWDTETYCLPFYIFNNPRAARNLLVYRYRTLAQALERARELDCEGARYPMCTLDGTESCGVWQHGDLEIHISVAVAYGIWHYMRVTGDDEFLRRYGLEMLMQICRYYASRGGWSPETGEFGFWGVMGPDEFHMMAHNNCYTNAMAKRTFEYALSVVAGMKRTAPRELARVERKVRLRAGELADWRRMAKKMRVPRDARTGVFEQHDGYFDMPHVDIEKIPVDQFPIYENWAYVRIFRSDMIKQPDVLLLMLFFSEDYSMKEKLANYRYYEPRCIHESSLSPGVHAILAAELGLHADARKYSLYAARLDLDDYNRNTHSGLHTTSMSACWMNMVYGFGGMRSDGRTLSFRPTLPKRWKAVAFRVIWRESVLAVRFDRERVTLRTVKGPAVRARLYDRPVRVDASGVSVRLPAGRRG